MKLREIHENEDKLEEIRDWIYSWEENSTGRKRWEKYQSRPDVELNSSGEIIFHRDLDFGSDRSSSGDRLDEIKYPFAKIDGGFRITNSDISSLKNAPKIITGSFFMGGCHIKSFEHAPEIIGKKFSIGDQHFNSLTSLSGIHKHISIVREDLFIGGSIKSSILGLILINPSIVKRSVMSSKNDELDEAIKIINKHLNKGREGVLEAQQELIESDLEDYAEL